MANNKILFTSDTHFFHHRIIDYCNRPFNGIKEMNEVLVENWNRMVNKNDVVYHLGDFGFTPRAKTEGIKNLQRLCDSLKGKIILIKGNHDTNVNLVKRFQTIKDYHVIHTHNQRFVLFHYPMRSWQFANHGSIHLYGHCHGNLEPKNLSFDVGIDNIANILSKKNKTPKLQEYYRPFTVKEVLEYANENLTKHVYPI